jgi:cyclase
MPCLLLRGTGLVKTQRFSDPVYVGDPYNAIRIFNAKFADELIVLDIEASRTGREPNWRIIEQFAGECYMPVCYGGGIRSVEDAARVFELGIEKVSIQSSAIDDYRIVTAIAERFGSQSVVLSVDVKHGRVGREQLYLASKRKPAKRPWQEWMTQAVDAGAGEVLLTSVDREGTMLGMDLGLIGEAANAVNVPLIANGGVGSVGDIQAAFEVGASAVAAGAYFVFNGPHRAVLITYLDDAAFASLGATS